MSRFNNQTTEETFDDFTAVGIAEGFIDCDSEDDKIKAWQHLENSGLGRSFQGWFGRRQEELIASGKIKRKVA